MANTSILRLSKDDDQWSGKTLASCEILKWIGIYLCFTFIFGVFLNGTTLFILLKTRQRSPIDIFIIALCFFDLLATVLGLPLPLTSNLACRWLYGKYFCYYEGFIVYFVGMIGLYLLTALSLNRYWIIVTSKKEQQVTFRTAYISICLSILGGLFWALPPIFGWNRYQLDGVRTSCSINWDDRTINVISYNTLMFIFAYIIPLIVLIYCNLCIYLKVREAAKNRKTLNATQGNKRSSHKRETMEQRTAKTILLVITTFVIAWTPYAIVAFISSFFSSHLISPLAGTIPAIFAKSSIYFNPLVYIISNSALRSKVFFWRKTTINKDISIVSDLSRNNLDSLVHAPPATASQLLLPTTA